MTDDKSKVPLTRKANRFGLINDKYSSLVQISNQPCVVIEIGSSLTKVGFSVDAVPRAILRTPLDLFDGSRRDLAKFLSDVYKHSLKTSPHNHKVCLIEDPTSNRESFERLVQCLFVDIRVPAICAIPSLNWKSFFLFL